MAEVSPPASPAGPSARPGRPAGHQGRQPSAVQPGMAVGEAVILLHRPLPVVGVCNRDGERERQQNSSLANGWPGPPPCTKSFQL